MYWAETAKVLGTEQYGSRKGRKLISYCLNKVCYMDLLRQKRHAGALGMNNLKGNYNWVVHTVATLVLVSFGLQYGTAKMLFKVLQLAKHCIKTGYGTLYPLYGGDMEDPEMGLGQGNGLAPTV